MVAESLARAGYSVFGCDDSRWNMLSCSRYIKGFDIVSNPFRKPREFVLDLARIIKKRGIDVLLPVHEDAVAVARFRELIPKTALVASPTYEALRSAMDKFTISFVAEKAGVPCPKTFSPRTESEASDWVHRLGGTAIIKTRRGNSGKGTVLVHSPSEASRKWQGMVRRFGLSEGREPLVQEYIEGDLYGSCFLASGGEVGGLFLEKYLRWKEGKFGTSVLREPVDWPLLADYTRKVVKELRWTGIGHLDFVGDIRENRAHVLEMNPRFWGAVNMAVQNGFNFPVGLVTLFANGKPEPGVFKTNEKRIKSLWIMGELIAGLKASRFRNPAVLLASLRRIAFPGKGVVYDDFRWGDPLALGGEALQYLVRYLRSGLSPNPVEREMMR